MGVYFPDEFLSTCLRCVANYDDTICRATGELFDDEVAETSRMPNCPAMAVLPSPHRDEDLQATLRAPCAYTRDQEGLPRPCPECEQAAELIEKLLAENEVLRRLTCMKICTIEKGEKEK